MADQASGSGRQPTDSAGGDSNHSRTSSSRRGRGRGRNQRNDRQSTPRRSRHDTRDFADPNELRGIIQSIEDRFETLRMDQRQEQEELQTRLLTSQDAIMQMLQEMRGDGPGPTSPQNRSDPTTIIDNGLRTHTSVDATQDEVHPSIEKGVEFDTIGGADLRTTPTRPIIRNRDRGETTSIQDNETWVYRQQDDPSSLRNPSVPISNMTYRGSPRLSKNVPEADSLDDGSDPTFKQWRASIRDKFRENADHFASEQSRCTHVWLKTTGLARGYLTPRYTSTDSQFKSVDEMLTCLETYFLTGTEKEEAWN